eukprot:1158533-Pelagomonas_calceolata.AAC.4
MPPHLLPVPTTRLSKRRLRPTVIADATDSGSTAPCSSAWPRAGCRLKGRSMRSPANHKRDGDGDERANSRKECRCACAVRYHSSVSLGAWRVLDAG